MGRCRHDIPPTLHLYHGICALPFCNGTAANGRALWKRDAMHFQAQPRPDRPSTTASVRAVEGICSTAIEEIQTSVSYQDKRTIAIRSYQGRISHGAG